jgi:citrate lyase beta subunit
VSAPEPAPPPSWPAACPRTWLFAPADQQRKLDSALGSSAEAVIADLEDSVVTERKAHARERALVFLTAGAAPGAGGPMRVVRINDPLGQEGSRDLDALAHLPGAVLMVPKATLASLERVRAAGPLSAIALVESALGVAQAESIAALAHVAALALGTIDLSAELGLRALPDGLELLHVRSRIVLACALSGVPAIDGVYAAVGEAAGLAEEARRARALGFAGKLCIHPAQLEPLRAALAPTPQELERARLTLAAYESARSGRRGAALLDGEMVDLASVRVAQRVLGLASTDGE